MKTNLEPKLPFERTRLQLMKRLAVTVLTAVMLAGVTAGCDSSEPPPPPPNTSISGLWNFTGYTDSGNEYPTSGIWTFSTNGAFTILGTINGNAFSPSGSYSQTGLSVEMDVLGPFSLSFSGDDVTLIDGNEIYMLSRVQNAKQTAAPPAKLDL